MAIVEEHHLDQQVPQVLTFAVSAYVRAHRGDTAGARRTALHARRLLSLLNHLGVWLADRIAGRPRPRRAPARRRRGGSGARGRSPRPAVPPPGGRRDPRSGSTALIAAIDSSAQAVSELSAAPLTTAELRVLAYLPTHLSFQAMAEDLFVSRNTVKTQAISIYRKLGVSSRGDAVMRARELGLVDT